MEDRVLPPPAVFVGSSARFVGRAARDSGAAIPEIRRAGGVFRPRPRLRANDAAKGDFLLHRGIVGPAEAGRRAGGWIHRQILRYGLCVHAGRDYAERTLFPDFVSDRRDGGLRKSHANRHAERNHSGGATTARSPAGFTDSSRAALNSPLYGAAPRPQFSLSRALARRAEGPAPPVPRTRQKESRKTWADRCARG